MKKLFCLLKAMSFLFVFLYANTIYSQVPQCGAGSGISATYNSDCNYTFTPTPPTGSLAVDHYHWNITSNGTYTQPCDSFATSTGAPNLTYTFCFSGLHDIYVRIVFTDGTYCIMKITQNVTCSTGIDCDPDPMRMSAIPDPLVEITYMQPYVCLTGQSAPVTACMYTLRGGAYDIACGWTWALRMPPTGCTPDYWTYYVEYTKVVAGCSTGCFRLTLDTTVQCINAACGQPIYIVATASSCCLPTGYQRAYYWTPNYASQSPIGPPTQTYGHCSGLYTCPGNSVCNETQVTMTFTSGWPSPPNCFTGGKRVEQRDLIKLDNNANIEQEVKIYNVQGVEIFYGKWKFASPDSPILNWPCYIGSGIYFVKFQNSGEKLTKLFKIN